MMFVALGIFLVASLLCAVSTSIEMLSLARILQGLGGGGLMTLSQALIGETIPPRERARYQGYLAGVMVTSSTFGPVAGGYLTHHFGWRSVFLVNLPLGLHCRAADPAPRSRGPRREQPWTFDGMGLVLFVAFIVPALLALEQAQRMSASMRADRHGAGGHRAVPRCSRCSAGSGGPRFRCCPSACCASPPSGAATRLPPATARRWSRWSASCRFICACVRGSSASETGLLLLPLMFGIGAGSMITGRIVSRTGLTTIFPSVGLIARHHRC